jgi:predicted O-methyltransferase YrrM
MSIEHSLLPPDFLPMLDELNRLVARSGTPLEGNLFYYHQEANVCRETVYSEFYPKRKNFIAAARDSTTMLEIGVNAGHSALLALACGVEYHGVDIAKHAYVKPTASFLKSQFGDRFHFYEGDSLTKLPEMAIEFPYLRFDMIHVDGHHGINYFEQDLHNAMKMALKDAWVIIDDTDLDEIAELYRKEVQSGALRADQPVGWEHYYRHAIARVA